MPRTLRPMFARTSTLLAVLCALTLLPMAAHAGGAEDFATYCAVCHGAEGKGDGAAASGLDPKPIDLALTKMSTEELKKLIKEGGAAVGRSPLMTPWGAVLDQAKLAEVVTFIEGLRTPAKSSAAPAE